MNIKANIFYKSVVNVGHFNFCDYFSCQTEYCMNITLAFVFVSQQSSVSVKDTAY